MTGIDKRSSIRVCFIIIIAVSLVYGTPFSSFLNNNKNEATGIGGAEAQLSDTNVLYTENPVNGGVPEPAH